MSDRQTLRIMTDLEGLAERVIVKITLDVNSNLIETTPRDTGWAASNWIPQIGSPYSVNDLPSGEEDIKAALPGQRGAQQQAMTKVISYKLEAGAVFVSNNVPYIGKLNDGYSKKAPAGFVQEGVEKAVTTDLGDLAS
jgi:hypothetical protein